MPSICVDSFRLAVCLIATGDYFMRIPVRALFKTAKVGQNGDRQSSLTTPTLDLCGCTKWQLIAPCLGVFEAQQLRCYGHIGHPNLELLTKLACGAVRAKSQPVLAHGEWRKSSRQGQWPLNKCRFSPIGGVGNWADEKSHPTNTLTGHLQEDWCLLCHRHPKSRCCGLDAKTGNRGWRLTVTAHGD